MKEEIPYEDFMLGLDQLEDAHMAKIETYLDKINVIRGIRQKVWRAQNRNYRVRYYLNDTGYSFILEDKGPMGFPGVLDEV